jgi:hypothetical protein
MKNIGTSLRIGFITSALLSTLLFASCVNIPTEVKNPVKFPDKSYEIYAKDVTGMSYGWKLFSCIPIGHTKYTEAIDEIWKKSELPISKRQGYTLVNIKQRYGTDWGIIVIGQNYLSVTADIVKIKPTETK